MCSVLGVENVIIEALDKTLFYCFIPHSRVGSSLGTLLCGYFLLEKNWLLWLIADEYKITSRGFMIFPMV